MGAEGVLIVSGVVVAGGLLAYFWWSSGGLSGIASTGIDVMKQLSPVGMASSAYDLTKKIGKDLKVDKLASSAGKSISKGTSKATKSVAHETKKAANKIAKPFKKIF
jgi:hypothetical protein